MRILYRLSMLSIQQPILWSFGAQKTISALFRMNVSCLLSPLFYLVGIPAFFAFGGFCFSSFCHDVSFWADTKKAHCKCNELSILKFEYFDPHLFTADSTKMERFQPFKISLRSKLRSLIPCRTQRKRNTRNHYFQENLSVHLLGHRGREPSFRHYRR